MATAVKTIVATGLSSGLGFEALKQLLQEPTPYRVIFGARDAQAVTANVDKLQFDRGANTVTVLPLELSDLKGVKSFAQQSLDKVGSDNIDYLFLNAGMIQAKGGKATPGCKWNETAMTNHFSQHYLIHQLRSKLVASKSRIVVVSSGGVRNVSDPNTLEDVLKANTTADQFALYSTSKFAQLLGAQWWRRKLDGQCTVVAVSPGLIPETGLARNSDRKMTRDMPDAKSVPEGAASILAAFTRSDFPAEPERMFLTSWGEWWDKDTIKNSLDEKLQDKWAFGAGQIEEDAGA